MRKLAIVVIAATFMAVVGSLPKLHAQEAVPLNPQGQIKPEPFADVPPDHWAYNAVEQLRRQGLIEGFPDGRFNGKRPVTRYEIAQMIARMITGLNARLAGFDQRITALEGRREVTPAGPGPVGPGGLTREQVEEMIRNAISRIPPPDLSNYVTKDQLATLQRLVDEFRSELQRLNVDVDAVKKQLADLTSRVEAIEAELARLPKISGNANLIASGSGKSDQVFDPISGTFRPTFDHDGRPLPDSTNVLSPLLGYYDVDLGIVARPFGPAVRVGTILNVGNYVPSYRLGVQHGHTAASTALDAVRPYKVFVNVPFRFFTAQPRQELTIGKQGTQLSPYTFKAIDPDTYTFIPREDSGEVVFFGANTTWRFGGSETTPAPLKLRAFAGTNPQDGRLMPLNIYQSDAVAFNPFALDPQGLTASFGGRDGATRPIGQIGNFAGARLSWGEPDVAPEQAAELPVGTAEQLNITPATPTAGREVAATAAEPGPAVAAPATTEPAAGENIGPFRNTVIGVNWLYGAGTTGNNNLEDARAMVYSLDLRTKIGPIRIEGEGAHGSSKTGNVAIARPKALDDNAFDIRGFYTFGLGHVADLELGGGWRRIDLGYLTPGYWGTLGSWKNPRGIQGPLAQVRIPLRWNIASFLQNLALIGSGEWYQGAQDVATAGAVPGNDPAEKNLRIDRYLGGVQFALTSRNTVDLGVEQVFRNYVAARTTDLPLSLPTMGVRGSALVGSRIKNTETYINLGVGHNFTPDVAMKLLYQLCDFQKYAVDVSNQPANYRGYVATAQVGVRF